MSKVFIVAEMSANHLGDKKRALKIIEAAANAGADAIKLQTWHPDYMVLDKRYVIKSGPWSGKKLTSLYKEAFLPWEWHADLFKKAKELGIRCFSTPFDVESVDFLESLGNPIYKIASFEIVDLLLIKKCAQTRKPMIISTGMASEKEISQAAWTAKKYGSQQVTLLKCTSAYPSLPEHTNLINIKSLANIYGCDIGLSDHSEGIGVAVAAVALGAKIIEKHLTISRLDGGPDASFSMEPQEITQLVTECRRAAAALEISTGENGEKSSKLLRRSLYIAKNMRAGDKITTENVRSARPAEGLSPDNLELVLNKTLKVDSKEGTPLAWNMILIQ